ncbi:MAG: phospholipase D-like domain-containing protein [Cyanobacteria bacterium P01_D01_bin.44]
MPTFQELKARYMGGGSSGNSGGSLGLGSSSRPPASVPIATHSQVTPLIHGSRYFPALKAEIDRLGSGDTSGQFIYLMGWWFGSTFSLDGLGSSNPVSDLLKAKARAGVDVRVMGWLMAPEVLQLNRLQNSTVPDVAGMVDLNYDTFQFIQDLRSDPNLANKALLNILAHPAGAVHMKFAVIGDSTRSIGFTGGIDFENTRHMSLWHDIAAKVEGPAVQPMFENFREQWNEIQGRSPIRISIRAPQHPPGLSTLVGNSHLPSTPALASRALAVPQTGQMHVHNLTTVPRMNFSTVHSTLSLPRNQAISYASNGRFELRDAWIQALRGAQTYIFIEDQAFTSAELFDTMNAQIKAQAALKVILVIGGDDPNGGNVPSKDFNIAVNQNLLDGLSTAQRDRIGIFRRTDTYPLPDGRTADLVVHSKTSLIDDHWALVGSANMMRRSLYTDLEHSVAFMDENNHAGVISYRRDLWGKHLGLSPANLQNAVDAWFNIAPGASLGKVERVSLPLRSVSRSAQEQTLYDEVVDPDSRQAWGGLALIRALMGAGGGLPGSGGTP